jgi:hypothetical protein
VWNFAWIRPLLPFEELQLKQLRVLLPLVSMNTTKEDSKIREYFGDGFYIVQSASNLIDLLEFPGSFSFTNLLWKSIAPLKIKMFIWLVL